MKLRHACMLGVVLPFLGAASIGSALAQSPAPRPLGAGLEVGASYQNDTSLPLYYLPAWNGEESGDREEREAALNPKVPVPHVDSPDPVVQNTFGRSQNLLAPLMNFEGIGFPGVNCNCAPPDPNGAVGATQYVQMVNEGLQVFDKTTGANQLGPVGISSLWAGFGGVCETSGAGDPVVLYDQLAQRWVISQFAGGSVITDECIAVSTTSDATGSYYRYGFHLGSNFYDYPHLGVWPDGYYMSMNVFNAAGTAYLGPQPFAFDRAKMLAGQPATFVTTGLLGSSFAPILPADLDGSTPPPVGAPNPFLVTPNNNTYRLYRFHADFATPANSSFTLAGSPAAAGYTALCPGTRACVPQPGTTNKLDGIGDRLMFRLAYRNFGDHESLVGTFNVNAGAVAGLRWFELRGVTSGTVAVFQQGTYQPNSDWRWLGSAAMDSVGNLAIGYSASSTGISPQLRYAGRLVSDPPNTLGQGETHLFDGTGSQTGNNNRWGDYSDLTVDPVDDCTFWFTSEYYATSASFGWRTRIGSFKFANCGSAPSATVTPASLGFSVAPNGSANTNLDIANDGGGSLTFAIGESAGACQNPSDVTWLSETPTSGTVAAGASTSVSVTANATGLAVGSYSANLCVTTNDTAHALITVPVSLTVTGTTTHVVTPSAGAHGAIAPPTPQTVNHGDSVSFTLTPDSGYRIDTVGGTCGGSLSGNLYTTSPVNADCTVSASFVLTTHVVTPSAGAHGAIAPSTPQTVNHGDSVSFTLTPDSGYRVDTVGGTCGGTLSGNLYTTNPVSADCTVSANFALVTHVVTPSAGAHGAIAPSTPQTVNHGASVSFTLTPASGYRIDAVGGTCGGSLSGSLYTTSPVNADCTVNASFAPVTHVVTPSAGAHGSIAPSTPQTVNDGAAVSFSVTPAPGYTIGAVAGCNGSLAGNVYTTGPVTADCTVSAAFNPPSAVAVSSGDAQSALVGAPFGAALAVRVTDAAATPVAGVQVNFTVHAAANGAGAVLSTATATTAANGVASVTATANGVAGSYSVEAGVAGVAATAAFSLTNIEQADLAITVDSGRAYVRYGMMLSYTVTVSNNGPTAASSVQVGDVFPAQLDIGRAAWNCTAGSVGSSCTSKGDGALIDNAVVVPAGGSVSWVLSAPVRSDASGDDVVYAVNVTSAADTTPGNNGASDRTVLVLLRSGFDSGDDGAQGATATGQ